jgi:class 3 adenylate cyclase
VAAILFDDVVGSTASQRSGTRHVVETPNHFFEITVEVVTL